MTARFKANMARIARLLALVHSDVGKLKWAVFSQSEGLRADLLRSCVVLLHATLEDLGMPSHPKTTGSKGMHVYVPIVRGPTQKRVWTIAKTIAFELAARHPTVMTAEYRLAKRPAARVLVDYNQNAWGRTLASVYSVRPTPRAAVSTPVTWAEVDRGVAIDDFRLDNVPGRVKRRGDLWAPLLSERRRFDLARFR